MSTHEDPQQQQQQQQQANRGILPSETLNALDYLVDRLNASSGRLLAATTSAGTSTQSKDEDAASPPPPSTTTCSPLPIRALLVGTNEGVGLSRSLGTAHTISQMQSNDLSFSHSGNMLEEVLSSIETVWATLVSAAPPHVMAVSAAGASSVAANFSNCSDEKSKNDEKKEDSFQPPHPLLSPLQMGEHIRTVTATFDNCTLIHVHMAPLVVTFVTLPEANIGAIRSMALPLLKVLLEPVRRALVRSRGRGAVAIGGEVNSRVVAGQMDMQQQQQQLQTNPIDSVLQQQLYHQQTYEQQQLLIAQQQQQQKF